MKGRLYIVATALLLLTVPAFAADDQDRNSGFGNELFEGKGSPAFDDPDFFDIDSLTSLEPAAGDEMNVIDSKGAAAEGSAVGLPIPVQKLDPGTSTPSGLTATFSTR